MPQDLVAAPDSFISATKKKYELLATIADEKDFDGSLFRNWTTSDNPFSIQSLHRRSEQTRIIYKIIAAIKRRPDNSIIPDGAELLTVPQVA